jgi:hypothetical protein
MALSPRDKRAATILGGVVGVALVGFLLMNVLGGGGGEEPAPPAPGGGTTTQPSPTPSPKTPRETLPPVALAGARDPFATPAVFATSPSPSGGVSPSGSASPSGSGSPSPSPTAPSGGASSTLANHTVVLVDIYASGTRAQIEVDGTVYTVRVGDTFDGNFRLASISGSCATVERGSGSATICLNPQK